MALFRAEICEAGDAVLFSSLQQRLMRRLKDEIRTGNFTERGLARRAGLSQPHVHNLLKGIRSATVESADAMLRAISADVIDLLHAPEAERVSRLPQGPTAAVARLRGAAGPGGRWDERSDSSQCTAVPCKLLAGVRQPAMLTVLPDPEMDGISGIALVDLRVSTDSTSSRAARRHCYPGTPTYWACLDRRNRSGRNRNGE